MITTNNYFEKIGEIEISSLPENLILGHNHLVKVTKNGSNWGIYKANPTVKNSIDTYLKMLNAHFGTSRVQRRKTSRTRTTKKVSQTPKKVSKKRSVKVRKPKRVLRRAAKKVRQTKRYQYSGQHVEHFSEELKFIKRFVLMHGKSKTPDQIRLFINALQKAMTERRIRKTSKYADEILKIQDALLALYTKVRNRKAIKVEIGEETRSHFLSITGNQRLLPSVRMIKRYIGLQGRKVQTTVVKSLLTTIEKAQSTKAIPPRDLYAKQISDIAQALRTFVSKNKVEGTLFIPSRELNGLSGIVDELEGISPLNGFNGYEDTAEDTIVRGSELAKMKFPTIGFRGKWLDFIGDPTKGFTAMVFGKPKFGKSILCIDFANYLSKNHGEVLYVSREEYNSGTLQKKVTSSGAYEVNFTKTIPLDLSPYDFVFLDSITMLGLTTHDLEELREEYPEISFVFVFQTTKQGAFRGSNEYQHNVDIVIEVPEIGHAIQFGRFNQGGEMEIF